MYSSGLDGTWQNSQYHRFPLLLRSLPLRAQGRRRGTILSSAELEERIYEVVTLLAEPSGATP